MWNSMQDLGQPVLVAMGAPPGGAPNIWVQLVPFALVLGIFYFIIILPMKRRQQKVQSFHAGLKVGDRVVTSGRHLRHHHAVERPVGPAPDCRQGPHRRLAGGNRRLPGAGPGDH